MNIVKSVLFSPEVIAQRVKELGAEITSDYKDKEVLFLGILKGAFLFMSDLCRYVDVKMEFDFMEVSSYSGGTYSTGQVRILKDIDTNIEDKNILIVEDIVDNGLTLDYLVNYIKVRQPRSLKICALLDKRAHRKVLLKIDYIGFDCPDEFVLGYGLDYGEFYRNLPFIGVLNEEFISYPKNVL
ncbi:MAG: Hypoxanthine-guanine phosphoribosyltransferase [bacterium ADurb.Bin363]|nr:MAG: Hypoxanthine-guanine phosphoribosyltransferase [bacterium ADurb.Bin363]